MNRSIAASLVAIWLLAAGLPMAVPAQEQTKPPVKREDIPELTYEQSIEAIQSSDALRQFHGAANLYEMGPEAADAVGLITEILGRSDLSERRELIHVLIRIGPASAPAAAIMRKGLDDEDFHTRYLCCRVLGQIGSAAKPAVPRLIELLGKPSPSVRRRAAEALGNLGPELAPNAVEPLIQLAKGNFHLPRVAAIGALGKFGKRAEPAVPILKEIAKNPKSPERVHAALALMRLTGDEDFTMGVLHEALVSENLTADAAIALQQIAPEVPAAIPTLIKALESPSAWVRMCAAEALAETGNRGRPALDALQKLLEDSQPDVRESAQHAIKQIQGANAKPKNDS